MLDIKETRKMNRYYVVARILFSASPLGLLEVWLILLHLCLLEESEYSYVIRFLGGELDVIQKKDGIPHWLYFVHKNKKRPWANCVVIESIRESHSVFEYFAVMNVLERANLLRKVLTAAVHQKGAEKGN